MKKMLSIILFSALLLTMSCSVENTNDAALLEESNAALIEQLSNLSSSRDKLPQPDVWVDCYKYSAIVVPATFKPESDPFDELYAMPMAMFYNGVPLISDSKPGDRDYNGGRWHLNVLKSGVSPTKYANACSEEDIDPADFDSMDVYFECPLRPRKN